MVAAAVIGGAVVGGVASNMAANQSADAQNKAARAQADASEDQLAFQQRQYADWQATYGPIQDNLSSFYQGLTPDTLVASGLQDYEKQYQASQQQIERAFAQRGVTSGAQDMMRMQSELAAAEARADIRTKAPLQVATAQQGFLNQQVTNPATQGVANAYSNQANLYGQQAIAAGNQAALGYQAMGQNIQQGFNAYAQYQQNQQIQQQNLYNTVAANPGYSAYSPSTGEPVAASSGWEYY